MIEAVTLLEVLQKAQHVVLVRGRRTRPPRAVPPPAVILRLRRPVLVRGRRAHMIEAGGPGSGGSSPVRGRRTPYVVRRAARRGALEICRQAAAAGVPTP